MKIVEIVPAPTPDETAAIEAALKRVGSGRIHSTASNADSVPATWREAARREAVDAGV